MRVTVAGLHKMIEPGIRALGYELVDVEYAPVSGRNLLRIYIDRPKGITVDDCTVVSRQVSAVLDVEDPISEAYTLEVSSPGLDRPLVRREDFERFAGAPIKVRMREAVLATVNEASFTDGGSAEREAVPTGTNAGAVFPQRRNFKGTLVGVDGDAIVVDVDQERYRLPIARIERARLVPQW